MFEGGFFVCLVLGFFPCFGTEMIDSANVYLGYLVCSRYWIFSVVWSCDYMISRKIVFP